MAERLFAASLAYATLGNEIAALSLCTFRTMPFRSGSFFSHLGPDLSPSGSW
jgi:hypothetical protein